MLSPGSRRRALGVLLAGLAGLAVASGPWSAHAQSSPGGLLLPTTSTTTGDEEPAPPAAPSSTTSTTVAGSPESTTTTALLAPPPSTTTTAPPQQPSPDPSPHDGDGGTPEGAGPFPPELRALMESVPRSGANNTRALAAALAPLQEYGLTETEAAVVGFGRFPVAGIASYSHDWWFPRFGPGWRLHQGTDIFAAHGTPVRAPVDGTVRITNGGLGGLAVYVDQPDGTYWYLAHLAGIPEGIAEGVAVTTGQVVGFVGDSGNARGGPPHLHFEIHPGGGAAIDPKPILDQFIADALALAPQVVEAYAAAAHAGEAPPAVAIPAAAPQPSIAALPPRSALLWTTAVSPAGGAVHLAEAEAARIAASIDWSARTARAAGPTHFQRQLAERQAAWWVQPLVHPRLARLMAQL